MAIEVDELHAAAERRLARVGQRHTRQRRAILELVAAAARPVSVPDLEGRSVARLIRVTARPAVVKRMLGSWPSRPISSTRL